MSDTHKRIADLEALLKHANAFLAAENSENLKLAARIAELEAERDQLVEKYEANTAILHARTKRMEELRAERDRLAALVEQLKSDYDSQNLTDLNVALDVLHERNKQLELALKKFEHIKQAAEDVTSGDSGRGNEVSGVVGCRKCGQTLGGIARTGWGVRMSLCHHHEDDGYGLVCGKCAEDYTHRLEAQLAEAHKQSDEHDRAVRDKALREALDWLSARHDTCITSPTDFFLQVAQAFCREFGPEG